MSMNLAAASSLPAMRSEDATRLTLATVVLVDADDASLAASRACLDAAGYGDIATASDADHIEELLAAHDPDVLLLAVRMPHGGGRDGERGGAGGSQGLGGLEALQRLRAGDQWQHLPIIMLAAHDDREGKRQAVEVGATEILSTPLDPSELVLRLRNALGFRSYQDRLLKRDPLTGLANRTEFMRRVHAVLAKASPGGTRKESAALASAGGGVKRSLLLIDIDRFKQINDSIGHAAGDTMLTVIAQRLGKVVARHGGGNRRAGSSSPTPWLARLDSDHFMALLPGASGDPGHDEAMREIVATVRAPIYLNRREFHVSASIGVACFPADGETVEILTQRAELATNQAKKRGGNTIQYFVVDMQTRATERLTLENHLRYAIRRDELRLYYQPKVDCVSRRVVGVEALIRWEHPVHGLIAPQRFIPVAEEAGLIDGIGEWALREACRQGAEWTAASLPPIHIAVNLSAAQLLQGDLAHQLAGILEDTGFPASRLTLELTESMLMATGDQALHSIAALKALGVSLSLDDFGTGYSPLTYLRHLPIDEIKIDRSFVHGLPAQQESAAIAGAIIALAGALGLQVVAEGVETEEELGFLCRFQHCHFQGFLFSKPLPGQALTAMLQAIQRGAATVRG